jgi:hypothetical protein
MKHTITLGIVLALAGTVSAQQAQLQRSIQTHKTATNVVSGREHPELIPDATAFRLYFLSVSLPENPTETDLSHQRAHLTAAGLEARDQQLAMVIIQNFKQQYTILTEKYGSSPELFLQEREDLVQATRAALKSALSEKAFRVLEAKVRAEKSRMTIKRGGE